MNKKAIYPGTFDPMTNGHVDIIQRAASLFPQLIVAVASNARKQPYFSWPERIDLARQCVGHLPGIQVVGFDTLLIHFARQQGANIILRGLRAVSDFEYEFQLAGMNRKLCQDIETIFLTPSEDTMFVSSSLVKEVASFDGDISQFVPPEVVAYMQRKA